MHLKNQIPHISDTGFGVNKLEWGGELKSKALKSPIIWPGGKSRIADRVWKRFGNVDNYCEPFVGSAAVLLRRPESHFCGRYRTETVNDANHFVSNFWRSIRYAPDEVAYWADNPVNEADLHATHKWLMRSAAAMDYRKKMIEDPDYFDAKIAGRWVWGLACWIGSGWCSDDGIRDRTTHTAMPQLDAQRRVERRTKESADWQQQPHMSGGRGVTSSTAGRPNLADAFDIGRGVNASGDSEKRIHLAGEFALGKGVNAASYLGTCEKRQEWICGWMRKLSDRLRLVRSCYGHWSRICDSDSTLTRLGTTAVFLDPPYPANRADNGEKSRDPNLYATDKGQDLDKLRDEILAWCRKWGQNKDIRVAVCCYEGDGYEPLIKEGWTVEAWEASGGYGNQRKTKGEKKGTNATRERIFWSPHNVQQDLGLFSGLETGEE